MKTTTYPLQYGINSPSRTSRSTIMAKKNVEFLTRMKLKKNSASVWFSVPLFGPENLLGSFPSDRGPSLSI